MIMEVAKYIDTSNEGSKEWALKLAKLGKGECVTCGMKENGIGRFEKYEPTIIKITSLGERINEK